MSREIEEIKSIIFANFGALGFYNPTMNDEILKDRDKVLNYLNRFESIDNVKFSEASGILETFENDGLLNKEIGTISYNQIWLKNQIEILKQSLLKSQEIEQENVEYKKVLSIIKEKNVDFDTLTDSETLDDYNSKMNWSYRRLTEEEFNTLKEWSKL